MDIIQSLKSLNQQLCLTLWTMEGECWEDCFFRLRELSPKLLLTSYPDHKIRITEQEAKFLMCEVLNNSDLDLFFSLENPIINEYLLFDNEESKNGELQEDCELFLYKFYDEYIKIANVVFKTGNPDYIEIKKSLEKLIKGKIIGNWFHIIEKIDNENLLELFEKISEALFELKNLLRKEKLFFTFCSLENCWACEKILKSHYYFDSKQEIKDFFYIDYRINNGKIQVIFANNWTYFDKW